MRLDRDLTILTRLLQSVRTNLDSVENVLDAGPILLQDTVEVRDDDDVASLHERIREREHRLLPTAVRAFAEGRVRIEGCRARVLASP